MSKNKLVLVLFLCTLFLSGCENKVEKATIKKIGKCTESTALSTSVCVVLLEKGKYINIPAPVMEGQKVIKTIFGWETE